jgi:hypothetical protein
LRSCTTVDDVVIHFHTHSHPIGNKTLISILHIGAMESSLMIVEATKERKDGDEERGDR